MSNTQKAIKLLEGIPSEITEQLSMRDIFETLSIMLSNCENDNFEPTVNDFLEALHLKVKVEQSLDSIKNGEKTYTTSELKKKLEI